MLARDHKHVLAKIRKEFDDARSKGFCEVLFFPDENKLQIGFKRTIESSTLDRICEHIRKTYGRSIRYEIFDDDFNGTRVLEFRNNLPNFTKAIHDMEGKVWKVEYFGDFIKEK